jgi:hypothetical protein
VEGDITAQVEVSGAFTHQRLQGGASMLADLDLLLTVVYRIADDFLPKRPWNARRKITDAEIVALCVAQAIMGIPSDPRFLAVADKRLRHLFPVLPTRDAFHKRRLRLSPQIEALIAHFARQSPGFFDDLLLVDSTPVECARSRETVKRGGASSLATRSPTPPTTGTAPATAATSGGSGCTRCSRQTAPRADSR